MPSENCVNEILKKLTKQNFISIFFMTLNHITPDKFLCIVKKDRNGMEKAFKEFLEENDYDTRFLMEILATIKLYRTLKLLKSCHHLVKSKKFHNRLDKFWKFLYEICEQMTRDDFKCLEMLLSENVADEIVYPEILLVKAYLKKVFTQDNLTNLSTAFRSCRPDISKLLDDYYDSYDEEFYHVSTPTKMSPCGLAVIVNHVHFKSDNIHSFEPRKDSLLDVEALDKLWKKFGFEVSIHNDLTDDQVIELFERLAKKDHTSYDVFVTCYLSHGSEGVVYGSNCKPILISQLEDIIANKCITLIDKPKLFFIQACQGDLIQQGVFFKTVPLHLTQNSNDISTCQSSFYNTDPTPLSSHVLKVFSTIPGFLSYGEPNKNSWFIDALVTNIDKYGHIRPIKEIMDKVINQVSEQKGHFKGLKCKQTAIMYSTMGRKLLLKLCK